MLSPSRRGSGTCPPRAEPATRRAGRWGRPIVSHRLQPFSLRRRCWCAPFPPGRRPSPAPPARPDGLGRSPSCPRGRPPALLAPGGGRAPRAAGAGAPGPRGGGTGRWRRAGGTGPSRRRRLRPRRSPPSSALRARPRAPDHADGPVPHRSRCRRPRRPAGGPAGMPVWRWPCNRTVTVGREPPPDPGANAWSPALDPRAVPASPAATTGSGPQSSPRFRCCARGSRPTAGGAAECNDVAGSPPSRWTPSGLVGRAAPSQPFDPISSSPIAARGGRDRRRRLR